MHKTRTRTLTLIPCYLEFKSLFFFGLNILLGAVFWIPFTLMHLSMTRDSKIRSLADKCVFHYRQSNSAPWLSQLPTTAACAVIKSLSTVQTTKQRSVVVGSWEARQPNILLMVAKNTFVGWALNFRFHMLLKGAVNYFSTLMSSKCLFPINFFRVLFALRFIFIISLLGCIYGFLLKAPLK